MALLVTRGLLVLLVLLPLPSLLQLQLLQWQRLKAWGPLQRVQAPRMLLLQLLPLLVLELPSLLQLHLFVLQLPSLLQLVQCQNWQRLRLGPLSSPFHQLNFLS